MANFSGLNTKEKENFGVMLTDSIKRAQSCNKAKKCTKKRDARAKLLFCQSKTYCLFAAFRCRCKTRLPIVMIQKFCYHGNATSHFSSIL